MVSVKTITNLDGNSAVHLVDCLRRNLHVSDRRARDLQLPAPGAPGPRVGASAPLEP
jgi:hypothetical protein